MSQPSKPPVFIVGAPRSGTTLLGRILNRHPALAVFEETRFFEEVYARRRAFGSLDKLANRERFANALVLMTRIRRLGGDIEQLRRALIQTGTNYAEALRCVLQFYADLQGKPRCGDKTPAHAYVTETLSEWYPGAPIIHLIRDPRDVVASLQRMPWAPKSVLTNAYYWVAFNRAAERSRHRPEYLLVCYERLVERPEEELARICSHIGEDYLDSLLEADSIKDTTWQPRASGPITRERLGKWREDLRPEEASLVEWMVGPQLQAHGYAPSTGGPSAPSKAHACFDAAVDLARRRLRRLPHWWLRTTQPCNLAAQEYYEYRNRWDDPPRPEQLRVTRN